jgi:anti-sigma regulatory factor (Ser/Thr protein kinase)/predicted ArsR family transcriptional regulator
MDWYLPGGDLSAVSALRREIGAYLIRHAESGAAIQDAELVVQELLANAVEHAPGPIWVRLTWLAQEPDLEVWDLGPGFDLSATGALVALPEPRDADEDRDPEAVPSVPPVPADPVPPVMAEGGRGLYLVSRLATTFDVSLRAGGGVRVAVRLPVSRPPSTSYDPAPLDVAALPHLEEADAQGTFAKESFLRALVVQLSSAVERQSGPEVSEQVVAAVGIAVGGQMEAAFRAVQGLQDRLTTEQLADCYVRLKRAIDGDFYVLELSDDRIVLGNTSCPFGDVVRKSPALCRMTSSVFGGIAARNSDAGAAVVLEERIAVGDPGCRVVVYLGEPPPEASRFAHRYRAPMPMANT